MAKKILVFLSQYRKAEMQSYAAPDGTTWDGALTNDAPIRYLLHRNPDVEELLCIVTSESVETYQRLQGLLKEDGYQGKCTEISYQATQVFEETVLPAVSNRLQPGDQLLLDITGGFRNAVLYLLLISRVLSYQGVVTVEAVYSSLNPRQIVDATALIRLFDLVGGMQEMASFGSVRTLKAYYTGNRTNTEAEKLLEAMEQLKECIILCRTQQLSEKMEQFNQALQSAGESTDPMLQVLIPAFRKKFGSRMDIPKLIRWCVESEMLQQALTIFNECIPDIILGDGKLIQIRWALPVEKWEYQEEAMAQLLVDVLQMHEHGLDDNSRTCSKEELCVCVRTEDGRKQLLQLFAGKYQYVNLPQYALENLAVVCCLAYGRTGEEPYDMRWTQELPKNRSYLEVLASWMEKESLKTADEFLAALYRCPMTKMSKLLERPKWVQKPNGSMKTKYGRTISRLAELMPLCGYQSNCSIKQLQKVLNDYVYIRIIRNMTNHANDTSTSDMRDLEKSGYTPPEKMGSREIGDQLIKALNQIDTLREA